MYLDLAFRHGGQCFIVRISLEKQDYDILESVIIPNIRHYSMSFACSFANSRKSKSSYPIKNCMMKLF